jgi:nucleotide-binding universal stress UspA family protein
MFTNLLVPLDGSAAAATAVSAARTLATAFDAQISLLRVVRRPNGTLDAHAHELDKVMAHLDSQARTLMAADLRAESRVRTATWRRQSWL